MTSPQGDATPSSGAVPGKVTVKAAGAVLWRPGKSGPEVAVIHRPRYDDWSFPKGKLDSGESYLPAAVREVLEETGFSVVLGRRLPTQLYEVSVGGSTRWKRVKYWAARAVEDGEFEPNDEVDRIDWLPVRKALHRLTRQTDVDLLESFAALPVDTAPIVLLRHAEARPRKQWHGADEDRPLTGTGQDQARTLPAFLAAFGDCALVTSPATRCVETLEPTAKVAAADLSREPKLSEEEHRSDRSGAAAKAWLRRAVEAGQPMVACTHRPVLPRLLSASAPGRVVRAGRRPLAPAEAWVLHVRSGSVLAVDRLKT